MSHVAQEQKQWVYFLTVEMLCAHLTTETASGENISLSRRRYATIKMNSYSLFERQCGSNA